MAWMNESSLYVLVVLSFIILKVNAKQTCVTVRVRAEYFQQSLLKSSKHEKRILSSSSFRSNYNRLSTSAKVSGSYLPFAFAFGGSAQASYERVISSVSQFSQNEHTEKSESLTFNSDFLQIVQKITTGVTIGGSTAQAEIRELVDSVYKTKPKTNSQLRKLETDYIRRNFGNGVGTIAGHTYTETQCIDDGCGEKEDGICSCSKGFTRGDNIGDGGEIFIHASQYVSSCEESCKNKYPIESTGITEGLLGKYSSGDGVDKNKCWCEFGVPKFGPNENYQTCTFPTVDGGWSNWGEYGECSEECGGGIQTRMRTCTNPVPQHGGRTCEQKNIGDYTETEDCNIHPCGSRCVDKNASCGSWQSRGECTKNPGYMNINCAKSCGKCGGTGGYGRKYSKGWLDPAGGVTNLRVFRQASLTICEEECTKNPQCIAYTYITSMQQCDLKDETGIGGGFGERDDLIAGLKTANSGLDCVAKNGKPCKFPFKDGDGTEYNECADYKGRYFWCATSVSSNGKYKNWGYCPDDCQAAETTPPPAKPPTEGECLGQPCGSPCSDGVCDGDDYCMEPMSFAMENPCVSDEDRGCDGGKTCGDFCLMGDIVGNCDNEGMCHMNYPPCIQKLEIDHGECLGQPCGSPCSGGVCDGDDYCMEPMSFVHGTYEFRPCVSDDYRGCDGGKTCGDFCLMGDIAGNCDNEGMCHMNYPPCMGDK